MPNVREEEAEAYQPKHLNPEILDEFVSEEEFDRAAMPPPPPPPMPQVWAQRNQAAQTAQPVPADTPASRTRLAVARAKATARADLPINTQIQLLEAVHAAATKIASTLPQATTPSNFQWVGGNISGPCYIADEFGLPKQQTGIQQPDWVYKKREFLKKLSSSERNYLLTGDPAFAFDPIVYEVCLHLPLNQLPQILQHNFDYIIPNQAPPQEQPAPLPQPQGEPAPGGARPKANFQQQVRRLLSFKSSSSSSSSATPQSTPETTRPPSPCPPPPKGRGRPPIDHVQRLADNLSHLAVSPPAASRSLRSSSQPHPFGPPAPQQHATEIPMTWHHMRDQLTQKEQKYLHNRELKLMQRAMDAQAFADRVAQYQQRQQSMMEVTPDETEPHPGHGYIR